MFGPATPFFGWHYPPFFLTAAAALATLPYAWALFAWLALSLAAYLAAIRAILPRPETLLLAAGFPGGVHQHRPRPERLPHGGPARRRACSGSTAGRGSRAC